MLRNLNPSTKLAIQAAVAVFLAIIVGDYFQLERAYWAVLTSLILISQTWGESIKKSFERVSMTILGGITGTLLYFILPQEPSILFIVILSATFFSVFFLTISYFIATFFITLFIVFLFALIGHWDIHILGIRIYETLIGAAIAVLTTALVFPMHVRSSLPDQFNQFFTQAQLISKRSFNRVIEKSDVVNIENERDILVKTYQQLLQKTKIASYEFFMLPHSQNQSDEILTKLRILVHYITSIQEVASQLHKISLSNNILAELQSMEAIFSENLKIIQRGFQEKLFSGDLTDIHETVLTKFLDIETTDQTTTENSLDLLCFLYYVQKANEVLYDVKSILHPQDHFDQDHFDERLDNTIQHS